MTPPFQDARAGATPAPNGDAKENQPFYFAPFVGGPAVFIPGARDNIAAQWARRRQNEGSEGPEGPEQARRGDAPGDGGSGEGGGGKAEDKQRPTQRWRRRLSQASATGRRPAAAAAAAVSRRRMDERLVAGVHLPGAFGAKGRPREVAAGDAEGTKVEDAAITRAELALLLQCTCCGVAERALGAEDETSMLETETDAGRGGPSLLSRCARAIRRLWAGDGPVDSNFPEGREDSCDEIFGPREWEREGSVPPTADDLPPHAWARVDRSPSRFNLPVDLDLDHGPLHTPWDDEEALPPGPRLRRRRRRRHFRRRPRSHHGEGDNADGDSSDGSAPHSCSARAGGSHWNFASGGGDFRDPVDSFDMFDISQNREIF